MTLEVPERAQQAVVALLGTSLTELSALAQALESLPPTQDLSKYVDQVTRESSLPRMLVSRLLPLLGQLQQLVTLRGGDEVAIATELLEAGNSLPGIAEKLGPDLQSALVRLLKARNVFLGNKADILQASRQFLFERAEIVTDLTPVFDSPVHAGPAGFIIRHTLRLSAEAEDDKIKTFEIAVTMDDILMLRDILDRATAKHEALLELLRNKEISCIG